MNHNKKNIISALVFSMLSIIAYLITYNNKVLFFLVFVCERLYSFGAKEELEKSLDDLELEDGTEQDCAVIALFSVEELDDQEYIALITVEDLESDDEEGALLLYRYNEDPEDPDTFSLDNIETDEEYETVTAVLDEILEDEE